MPLSTRSHGASSAEQAEAEFKSKHLEEQEKVIREQRAALRREQEEFDKSKISGTVDLKSLMQVLGQIQSELMQLKSLPDQVSHLEQRVNEASMPPSVVGDVQNLSLMPEAPVQRSYLKIKDVIANIPPYDGYKISVFQFAASCERARDLLPVSQEAQLVQLIINKLEGDAYRVVESGHYTFVTELTDKLKTIFAPKKSVSQYRGELANIYKLPTETILKYAGRIKDLRTALIDTSRRQGRGIDRPFLEEIDAECLEAFVNGLPSDLIVRMEHRSIDNLDHAMELAVNLTRTMEVEKTREKQYAPRTTIMGKPTRADTHTPPLTLDSSTPMRDVGKVADSIPRQPIIRPLIPGQPGPNFPQNTCKYCKAPGHDISACRKLAYKNAQPTLSGNAKSNPALQGASREATLSSRPALMITPTEPLPKTLVSLPQESLQP